MAGEIKIDGLAQFSRDLKKLNSDLPKALRVALNQAADIVVQDARPRVRRRTGKAAASVKAASSRTAVRVREGGNRAPYMPWLDFGGKRRGRGGGVAERPRLKDGRFIYQAYFKAKDSGDIQKVLEKALLDVAAQAGVEVD